MPSRSVFAQSAAFSSSFSKYVQLQNKLSCLIGLVHVHCKEDIGTVASCEFARLRYIEVSDSLNMKLLVDDITHFLNRTPDLPDGVEMTGQVRSFYNNNNNNNKRPTNVKVHKV